MDNVNTVTAQLCGCNNCDAIMIDENPDNQPELTVEAKFITEMAYIKESEDREEPVDGSEYCFWGCPNCLTDGYLTDINSEEHLKSFLPKVP